MIPLSVDVGQARLPWANWVLILTTIVAFYATSRGLVLDAEPRHPLILDGFGIGVIGHVLLHADLLHLAGNMLFLWVFGNAVCSRVGSLVYPLLYVLFAVVAALAHAMFEGNPAVGASGAIAGVVGMFVVLHPKDYVAVGTRWGAVEHVPAWVYVLIWLAINIAGWIHGDGRVGYVAHIAGLLVGSLTTIGMLHLGKIAEGPSPTLLDLKP